METLGTASDARNGADVRFLKHLIDRQGSIGYARVQAQRRARTSCASNRPPRMH